MRVKLPGGGCKGERNDKPCSDGDDNISSGEVYRKKVGVSGQREFTAAEQNGSKCNEQHGLWRREIEVGEP